ncbi:MAG TPA: hypothetical protein VD902_20665 [Symbiobacteriaceae bacterium]|nr:hypothetical protein [Symbiobacteriaceae bacterium]
MTGRMQPLESPRVQQGAARPWASGRWFAWWAAACLVAVAYLTYQQLAAQQRILVGSQALEAKVAEAARISAETNLQLGKVKELDTATTGMGEKLKQIGEINAALKGELLRLETTVTGLEASVGALDQQAVQSNATLRSIASQSDALLVTLRRSRTTGEQVSDRLARMLELQEGINADLAEMNRKTEILEWLMGGSR